MRTMKSCVSSACDYSSLAGKSDQGWHFRWPPPTSTSRYHVVVLRGKHVPQSSANSKVIHQQNEIINVINRCSHTSIFRRLEIGPGGWWWWCLWGGMLQSSAWHLSRRRSLFSLSHQGVWGNLGG